jgi:PKD repeat protein
MSSNHPTTWSWNFGDGNSSAERNPVHVFSDFGLYTITLTVTNSYGSDMEVKTNYIIVKQSVGGMGEIIFNPNIT